MTTVALPELVRGLLDPKAYPWRPAQVEVVETHMSWVFLAGDRVVKVRRPVAYSFVDHTILAARERSAREEVRINRRLTSGVYLGVEPVTGTHAAPVLGGSGPVIEWATVMRRLPADRMLDGMLQSGAAPFDTPDRLANRLVPFHRNAAHRCEDAPYGSADALLGVLTDNLADLAPFSGSILGAVQFGLVEEAIDRAVPELHPVVQKRREEGWIRDGHGDLRAEHVCLEANGMTQVFDAVEFSAALRCADVASDLGYLLIDLRRRGANELAGELVRRYRSEGVDLPPRLLRLYMAHRALVKAKTVCLELSGTRVGGGDLLQIARSALDAATWAAVAARPSLVVMSGLSGTGKSTVARRVGESLGSQVVSSDVERRRIAGSGASPTARYSEEMTTRTYRAILGQAEVVLRSGRGVVLDATFLDRSWRDEAAAVAARGRVPAVLVETTANEDAVLSRLHERAEQGTSASEATEAVYLAQKARIEADPPGVPLGMSHVTVATDQSVPDPLDPFFALLTELHALSGRLADSDPFA